MCEAQTPKPQPLSYAIAALRLIQTGVADIDTARRVAQAALELAGDTASAEAQVVIQ
jgi:hypothetical protein